MSDFLTALFTTASFIVIIKISFLIFIGFLMIYALLLMLQSAALKKIVFIRAAHGSAVIQILTVIYLVATLVLFLVALAIL